MIKPVVGRVVWYWTSNAARAAGAQPLAAQVAHVWSDTCINIGYLDANGRPSAATSVRLVQDGEDYPSTGPFCEWMPYQKGQAAKAEAAEKSAEVRHGDVKDLQAVLDKIQPSQLLTFPPVELQPPHKVTQDDVDRAITMCEYHVYAGGLTIAILRLRNGYLVTGQSCVVSTSEFDADLGRKYALKDAERKVWMLLGYQLKEEQYQRSKTRVVGQAAMGAIAGGSKPLGLQTFGNPGLTD